MNPLALAVSEGRVDTASMLLEPQRGSSTPVSMPSEEEVCLRTITIVAAAV